jgi:hypothetical protein
MILLFEKDKVLHNAGLLMFLEIAYSTAIGIGLGGYDFLIYTWHFSVREIINENLGCSSIIVLLFETSK